MKSSFQVVKDPHLIIRSYKTSRNIMPSSINATDLMSTGTRTSARSPQPPAELSSDIFRYVLAESGLHQLALAVLSAIVFLLEIVPLELQRRIINDLAKERHFQLIVFLCAVYACTVLLQGG